jgi:hypothetical protein
MTTEPAATTSFAWSSSDVTRESGWNQGKVGSRALGSIIEMPATTAGVSTKAQAATRTANSAIEWHVEHPDSTAAGVPSTAVPFRL